MRLLREITGFDISSRKQRWKLMLIVFAALIVGASLYYADILVKKIAEDERVKVSLWADAVQRRASLVRYTEAFFETIKTEERKRVELQARVHRRLFDASGSEEQAFLIEVLQSNTTIPVLLVDEDGEIAGSANLDERFRGFTRMNDALLEYFSEYEPIEFPLDRNTKQFIYYRDSRLFTELRDVLDDLVDSFISDIVISSANIPVIVTDSSMTRLIDSGNIQGHDLTDSLQTASLIRSMATRNPPIVIDLPTYGTCHVLYTNSFLVTQLRYFPIVQLLAIGIFLLLSYVLFSLARNAEQNLVWVGMSKETAHQLGTPLSSLLAWLELLKSKGVDDETLIEIRKDVNRLESITERFSKIGSSPDLHLHDLTLVLNDAISYMKTRTSSKVSFRVSAPDTQILVPLNASLFEWVVENIVKNAVDAMNGKGAIDICITDMPRVVYIDVSDSGKGIPHSKFQTVFKPGFTSKKRGWGLGLSLSRRIIENYHKGRVFVKESAMNKGTTFRIILKK